jgi:heme exporter protein A
MKLVAENLTVLRGERAVIANLSFEVAAGGALVLTGPNGSGKSTLLRAICGLLAIESGSVGLEGAQGQTAIAGAELGENCHYLGHLNSLKPALTAAENLGFWRDLDGPSRVGLTPAEALARVGMEAVHDLPAGYLSAGQKRRVAIARLLVSNRPVWLADEPTAALDARSEARFAAIASQYVSSGGILLAATHQPLDIVAQKLDLSGDPAFAGFGEAVQ